MIEEYRKAYEQLLGLNNLSLRPFSASKAELRQSLTRTRDLLHALGNPDESLNIVHVAGTSGKGSVSYALVQMLHAQGIRVGAYLSPHTSTFLERFVYNDGLLPVQTFLKATHELIEAYHAHLKSGHGALSFFELSTVLALLAFNRVGATWLVLEAGCGGRWDATNVIQTPKVAVITNIDKDHTDLLGNSLTKIAYEKAGIIKKNGVVYCGEHRPRIKDVFTKEALKQRADISFIHPPRELIIPEDTSTHQQHNASLATAVAKEIGVSDQAIIKTFNTLKRLPCRFETIQKNPLIILDGAHSPAKVISTAQRIKSLHRPAHLIFGCAENKDTRTMIQVLAKHAVSVRTTRFAMEFRKAANPFDLLTIVPTTKRAGAFLLVQEALEDALKQAKPDEVIIVTGSLFLAGELRTNWIREEAIIKTENSFPKYVTQIHKS